MTRDDVINSLKSHKRNVAVYESLLLENNIHIPAQTISDMPKAQNKFSSSTENQALSPSYSKEMAEVWREIRRVNIWLEYLQEEERFVIEQFYLENRPYGIISHKWSCKGNPIYSSSFWKDKRRLGINKILELCEANV